MGRILSAREAAALLHIDRIVILKLLDIGEIPAIRVGNRWKIDEDQLTEWFRSKSKREALARKELNR